MRSRFSALSSTTSTRAMSAAGRQADGERASLTEGAAHEDLAAEQLRQLLADEKAEPSALEGPGLRRSQLFEGDEQALLVVFGDAEASVGDAELDRAPVAGEVQRQGDAPGIGKLDRVVGEVDQDLGKCPAVGAEG